MKKIIRIASVIALASASLLYVGCTKDFSADIAKTNQDVAALNQKIETLNSTVQTINGTVENLKTTKADLSAVNALGDKVTTAEGKITTLGGKIDDLDGKLTSTKNDLTAAIATAKQEAIDAASADAATKLAAAKTELEGVINGVKAKVDSLEAFTVAQTDSLRKDVDSLYANYEALEARIAALEGKVNALAVRVTSIVAVPSMNAEFREFYFYPIDTTFFTTTFAVTPKAAVKNINPEDLKVNFKEGLTRVAGLDTTFNVAKVVADETKGEITVFVAFKGIGNIPSDFDFTTQKFDWTPALIWQADLDLDGNSEEYFALPHISAVYYSLSFAGEDKAGKYEESSEYVKAHNNLDYISDWSATVVNADNEEITEWPLTLCDTLAFDGKEGKEFASLFNTIDVAFRSSAGLISRKEVEEIIDSTFTVCADTLYIQGKKSTESEFTEYADTSCGIAVTRNGSVLVPAKVTKGNVGDAVKIIAQGLKFGTCTKYWGLEETHYVGAKTVEFTLPAVSEPWTYTSWEKVSRTVSITDCADVHAVVPTSGIEKGKFEITPDSGTGVNIAVTNALRNPEAKDTVYNVVFKHNVETLGPNDTVNFTINWKYTLEGRPADATIALADVDTLANDYTQSIELAIDSKIVDKTFAAFDAAYDKTIDSAAVTAAIKSAEAKLDSVVFNGKKVSGADLNANKTAVVLPALSKAGAYSVILNKTVFGIKYTYTYTINLKWEEKLTLHATPYISADGVAVVDADTTVSPYTLKTMDMAKYLQVFDADTLAKNIAANKYTVKFKVELEDSSKFANKADTLRGSITDPADANVTGGFLAKSTLDWSSYNGREVKVTAYLANSQDTVDTYTFTLRYEKPVRSFTAGTQTIKRVAGIDASAVLSKSFNITGLYNGDKNLIVDTTGAWINGKNYYDCEIEFDITKATFKVDGVATEFAKNVDYKFTEATDKDHPESAKITFIGDNNNKPIEASIPVVLKYKYDYNNVQAYKDNVVIKVVNE